MQLIDEAKLSRLTRAREGGGGRFCPPLMFFVDNQQTNRFIFTIFSVPDQK